MSAVFVNFLNLGGVLGTKADDRMLGSASNDIFYKQRNGVLLYDPDGGGQKVARVLATLDVKPSLIFESIVPLVLGD